MPLRCASEAHLAQKPHSRRGASGGRRAGLVAAALALVAVGHAGHGSRAHAGGNDPRQYVVAEALFLQRNNATVDRPVVVDDRVPDGAVLTAQGLMPHIGSGARLIYGDNGADGLGWEVGYFGVFDMSADRQFTSADAVLQAGGELGTDPTSGLNQGVASSTSYDSQINSLEINSVWHRFDGGRNRRSPRPWQRSPGYDGGHVDWLLGFRWAGLEEQARLGITPDQATIPNTYDVQSSSNLFAAQVGTRGRWAWQNWAFEGWMKVGMAGATRTQSQSMFDQFASEPFRSQRSSEDVGMGLIADMNLSAIWRFTDTLGLRVGYNLFWLTGVALAPDQWDFSNSQASSAGTAILGTGSVFLSGANIGLEARW